MTLWAAMIVAVIAYHSGALWYTQGLRQWWFYLSYSVN